ncbi:hypothetical protein ACPCKW_36295, partial [Streptomyces griseoincarnatus]
MPNEHLRNLMFAVVGEWFPLTDEDVAAVRGQIMEATRGKVDILKGKVDDSVSFVGDALPGDVGTNFVAAMGVVRPELDKLTDGMGEASTGLRKTAMDVREAKWNLIAELIRLAAEIAVLTALAAVTAGASASQIALRKMIARVRMLIILHELASRIPLFSAIPEAIEEALLTLGTRLALMRWAPGGQRPGGVDWRDVGISAAFGALVGAFADLFGGIVRRFTNGLNNAFDNWMKDPPGNKWRDDLGDTLGNGPGRNQLDDLPGGRGGFDIRREIVDEIGQAPSEGAAETLAEGLVNEIFYGGFRVEQWTALGAIVSRQFERGLIGLGQGLGGALNNFFSFKSDLRTNFTGGSSVGGGPGGGGNGFSNQDTEGGGNGRGLDGPLGGRGPDVGNVGDHNRPFRTETGGPNGLNGLNSLNGLNGPNGLSDPNGLNGPGGFTGLDQETGRHGIDGPNAIGGPGSLNGGNGSLTGPGPATRPNQTDGLDELRHHNGLNPVAQFDGPLPTPGPPTAPPADARGPEATAGTPGGRVPTASQPLPDTASDPQRHLRPGDFPQTPDPQEVREDVSELNQPQPRPQSAQPETATPPPARDPSPSPSPTPPESHPGESPAQTPADDPAPENEADAPPHAPQPDGPAETVRSADLDFLRDQHADALRRLTEALDTVQDLRDRLESGAGTSQDPALLEQALDRVARAGKDLTSAEDLLRDRLVDPHTLSPDLPKHAGPVVERDDVQRQWIAGQVTPQDLADGIPDLDLSGTVSPDRLHALGITVPPGLRVQWDLGNTEVPLRDAGLPAADQARLLMLDPGPWPSALDTIAANTTRRLWQEAYTDFADAANPAPRPLDGDPAAGSSRAWSTATALVLPLEAHPARADSRYATGPYRDAVRDVADLLVAGAGPDEATALADRLRTELGLPPREPDVTPLTADPTGLPMAIPTASVSARQTAPALAPRPQPLASADTPTDQPDSAAPEPAPVVARPLLTTSSDPALTPHPTIRDSSHTAPIADLASRLLFVDADQRARLLDSLSSVGRRELSADVEFVRGLRARLSPEDFAVSAAQLLVDRAEDTSSDRVDSGSQGDPDAVRFLGRARREAESIVAGML